MCDVRETQKFGGYALVEIKCAQTRLESVCSLTFEISLSTSPHPIGASNQIQLANDVHILYRAPKWLTIASKRISSMDQTTVEIKTAGEREDASEAARSKRNQHCLE